MKRDHPQPAVPGDDVSNDNPSPRTSEAGRLPLRQQQQTTITASKGGGGGISGSSNNNKNSSGASRQARSKIADLHVAISSRNKTLVARIAPHCTRADVRTPFRGMTALSLAVFNADCEIVKVSDDLLRYAKSIFQVTGLSLMLVSNAAEVPTLYEPSPKSSEDSTNQVTSIN